MRIGGRLQVSSNSLIVEQKSDGAVNCGGLLIFTGSNIVMSGELLISGNSVTSYGGDGFVSGGGMRSFLLFFVYIKSQGIICSRWRMW